MIDTALRSLAHRKLRTALTAIAIVLGVAMIAGTYVQTDRIDTAFAEISEASYEGADVVIEPHQDFSGTFTVPRPMPQGYVTRTMTVPGVDRAEGQLYENGQLVVGGETVKPTFAPTIVSSVSHPPFDVLRVVAGSMPTEPGDVVVDERTATEQHVEIGQRVGVTTRTGEQPARVAGIVRFGDVSSVGGATFVGASLEDVQRWFDRHGRVSGIFVSADPGVSPAELQARIRDVLPASVDVKTGAQSVAETSQEIDDAMSFLRPALLAFAGAALLVGAFIIFNTFSITVAERTREFAMLRALGATRGQVLRSVAVEALALGSIASLIGLGLGLGFARLLGALFDAAGMGIPAGGANLEARTIIVSLAVGVLVMLLSALVPAIRATRVAPVIMMQAEPPVRRPRHPRIRALATTAVALLGIVLVAQGMLGGGPATSRLGAMGSGVLLVFIGVAASARYIVRPLAAVAGWPLRRIGVMGELAEENAARNPGRTAVTAGALMVGLGLVVFVAVFAAGLTGSLQGSIDERMQVAFIVTGDTGRPVPAGAMQPLEDAVGAERVAALYADQVEVNGNDVNTLTDIASGVDPDRLTAFYDVDWRQGSDADLARLHGPNAILEEQFAKQHDIAVGDRFTLTGPSGRSMSLTAIGEYRDPQILQGVMIDQRRERRLSAMRDPYVYLVARGPGVTRAAVDGALARFPTAKARTVPEYRDLVIGQVDQIVTMLYALLAMSLIISLFGIANSLFLSIHERTRELGMLRAIGATARQVRSLIRSESIITAVIGGLLGTVIGVVFAWLTTYALDDLGLIFELPVVQLIVLLVVAVVIGVIAAIVPARRAARMNVLEAVAAGE